MASEFVVQGIPVSALAEEYGTPLYIYDSSVIRQQFSALTSRLHPAVEIFYSLKANPNVAVSALLRSFGAGAEVSSAAELVTALRAGFAPADVIFVGPGKSTDELTACLRERIYATVCESICELTLLDELARRNDTVVPVALRVNPPFTVKGSGLTMGGKPRQFGIDHDALEVPGLPSRFPHLRFLGVHFYLGTRILDEHVIGENIAKMLQLAENLSNSAGFPLEFVDVGGGFGIAYFDRERDLDVDELARSVNPSVETFIKKYPGTRLVAELGRFLTAPAGIYLVRVRYVKTSMGERFAVTDGGTNHHMAAVGIGSFVKRNFPVRLLTRTDDPPTQTWHITGPLCTPNDVLASDITLPALNVGDLIGVMRSGAYGPSASPVLFLGHGYPAEVIVHQGRHHLVRTRDQVEDLLRPQSLPPLLFHSPQEVSTP